jgi:hypothetical protein
LVVARKGICLRIALTKTLEEESHEEEGARMETLEGLGGTRSPSEI